ncbi:protein-tyrosine sulfotransferase 1 [Lingula anatina]|uniref:Protein-tyrosine sulfotransferase n=1 Tax=Lingula anatina TaxID=7574 RepID=A0A1S3HH56_LINAN|nr:protein-tyrosine sulfotransferase 1 [Lingula anatina]|eukprot:XP_013384364.1 protein-tyrosine sulfotransferase 1 [Lingula anatina]
MAFCRGSKWHKIQFVIAVATILIFVFGLKERKVNIFSKLDGYGREQGRSLSSLNYDYRNENHVWYDKNIPLIWIGGVPRSGTTLARAMLDAHPAIRCGEETRVIPRVLGIHGQMANSNLEMTRLQEAKITSDILDGALGAYILSIIAHHGEPAPRLCNKDPFALKHIKKLSQIFPNSKFILMIRDGRATVHSIITRKVTIRGFNTKSWDLALKDWNRAIKTIYDQCVAVGNKQCLPVHYEQLVLHPKSEMERILNFLNVPWNDSVLHHEKSIGKPGGVSLSRKELSTDQVNKPLNKDALWKWVDHIPQNTRENIGKIAPMLSVLGYDITSKRPTYEKDK